jgi:hypothetical protein
MSEDTQMSSKEELEKAKFLYDCVAKSDDIATKAYERINAKIHTILGVLSTVIPISIGIGYYILSSSFSLPFFLLFIASLVFFIIALGKSIHLLDPKWFLYVDARMLMERYDDKPLSFIVFKIASTWDDVVNKNVQVTNSLRSGLRQVVFSILIGLCFLILAFIALGVQFYLRGAQVDPSLSILISRR